MAAAPACAPRQADPSVAHTAATPAKAAAAEASDYFPLQKGSYWLYEVAGPGGSTAGFKQVLVTDESPATDRQGATDVVLSIIDHSVPREQRADEPTIIRRGPAGLECVECGGLVLPARFTDRAAWNAGTSGAGPSCRLADAGLAYRTAAGDIRPAVVVACSNPATNIHKTQLYARGVGPVLTVVTWGSLAQGLVRVERLREQRTLDPNAPFPPLPTGR